MKKLIAIFLLAIILLNGIVYGNKKAARPARQYIECRPIQPGLVKVAPKTQTTQLMLPVPIFF